MVTGSTCWRTEKRTCSRPCISPLSRIWAALTSLSRRPDTPRRAQYDLCVNALVLDAYDKRGTTVSGSALTDNREYRGTFLQLQATEPVSESDT